RLDIATLTLRVERVEGQRRLAGAGQAGDHDQLVTRQGQVDVLQVVGARPTDQNLVHLQRPRWAGGNRRLYGKGRVADKAPGAEGCATSLFVNYMKGHNGSDD